MLQELHITNYALIDNLDVTFRAGLNIITGETGAGKSIMLGALSLIFGGRADSKTACRGDKKSVIECTFDAAGCEALRVYCRENDIEWMADNQFILRREIAPSGRSRAFINDTPVAVSTLADVALFLVDIHSQHKNMLLAQPRFQLDVIDALADNKDLLADYAVSFAKLKQAIHLMKTKRAALKKTADNADFLSFQLDKIKAVNPQPGELADLEALHEQMSESVKQKESLIEAIELLNGTDGIIGRLDTLADLTATLAENFDGEAAPADRLAQIKIELTDIARSLEAADKATATDPRELEYIENRITQIEDLMGRFGAETDSRLFEMRTAIENQLSELESATEITRELETAARKAMAEARAKAAEISSRRREAAATFAQRLKETAMPLGMPNLRIEIEISETDLSSTGFDKVNFLFAFNKNQELMPVANSASGGEISRLMLCIKAIVADKMSLPSILFDEIDTGISGEIAAKMGRMMHDMSANLQTIVITHLPQVAAAGDSHYKVYKEDDESATHTKITELNPQQRIEELAVMLGGDTRSDASRLNAIELLKKNGKI